MEKRVRRSNFFEIVLLIVGVGIMAVGIHFINQMYQADGHMTWDAIQAVFLWLLLFVMVILLATEEDVKEELGSIMKSHIEETKLLKEETIILKEELSYLKEDTILMKSLTHEL
ncbi:hypothetical protein JW868_00165, partial [Candidatus Woesearchaeota archaeon]|nr:hypothetical protein [Candidatus Woesearchaeota archaeon]